MLENEIFAQRLKQIRAEHGLTQKQLANSLNIIHQNVSNWEKGVSFPNLVTFTEVCQLLNCSSDYLLGLSDYPSLTEVICRTIP